MDLQNDKNEINKNINPTYVDKRLTVVFRF